MQTLEVGGKKYSIASCWMDVPYFRYEKGIAAEDPWEAASILAGLPEELNGYDFLACPEINEALAFLITPCTPEKKWKGFFVPDNLKHLTVYELHILDDQAPHHPHPYAVIASVILRKRSELPKPGDDAFARHLPTPTVWRRCDEFTKSLPAPVALACAEAWRAYRTEIQSVFASLFKPAHEVSDASGFGWMEIAYSLARIGNTSISITRNLCAWDAIYDYIIETGHLTREHNDSSRY